MNFKFKALRRKSNAYKELFLDDNGEVTGAAKIVLNDLMLNTGGTDSVFDRDPVVMSYKAGRQDIVRRITKLIHLSENQINQLIDRAERQNDGSDSEY